MKRTVPWCSALHEWLVLRYFRAKVKEIPFCGNDPAPVRLPCAALPNPDVQFGEHLIRHFSFVFQFPWQMVSVGASIWEAMVVPAVVMRKQALGPTV